MRKEDCVELFTRIPQETHPQVNLVLRNCFVLSVDVVIRFEPTYLVFRGREGGTTDEGRGFFVPYDEISYFRIERPVRVGEMKMMFGETGHIDAEDRLSAEERAVPVTPPPVGTLAPAAAPTPITPNDPASIAKQNLLDRIRAARANVAGTTGKLGNGAAK